MPSKARKHQLQGKKRRRLEISMKNSRRNIISILAVILAMSISGCATGMPRSGMLKESDYKSMKANYGLDNVYVEPGIKFSDICAPSKIPYKAKSKIYNRKEIRSGRDFQHVGKRALPHRQGIIQANKKRKIHLGKKGRRHDEKLEEWIQAAWRAFAVSPEQLG